MLDTPFHFLLSIGGECDFYLDTFDFGVRSVFQENKWRIIPVNVKYSTSANHQYDRDEYLIMNFDINKLPKMVFSSEQLTLEKYL